MKKSFFSSYQVKGRRKTRMGAAPSSKMGKRWFKYPVRKTCHCQPQACQHQALAFQKPIYAQPASTQGQASCTHASLAKRFLKLTCHAGRWASCAQHQPGGDKFHVLLFPASIHFFKLHSSCPSFFHHFKLQPSWFILLY